MVALYKTGDPNKEMLFVGNDLIQSTTDITKDENGDIVNIECETYFNKEKINKERKKLGLSPLKFKKGAKVF
jgi:phosphopantetheine adenylyltransferase